MKVHNKAFSLAAIAIFMAVAALAFPVNGNNSALAPFFFAIAFVSTGLGLAARFGTQRVQQWLVARF